MRQDVSTILGFFLGGGSTAVGTVLPSSSVNLAFSVT